MTSKRFAQVIYFFHEAARTEHLEHVAHYESCQIGLGARVSVGFRCGDEGRVRSARSLPH